MNVMSPDLLWISDRCYRLPELDSSADSGQRDDWIESETPHDFYEEEYEDDEDEASDISELIETLPNNRFKLSVSIPQTFWSKIIGAKGLTKKRIETDTNTTILIPRPMEHGDVVIKGTAKRNLILAKKSIDAVVSSSRQKLVFTHFISIPMNCEEIKKNFATFKSKEERALAKKEGGSNRKTAVGMIVIPDWLKPKKKYKEKVLNLFGKDRGVDSSIFQNPDKLHLTIGTLVLTDQNERRVAEKILNDAFEKSVKPLMSGHKDIFIEMTGIEYMNDDPAEVDVLYSKITSNGDIIQKIANQILSQFSHHKLLKSEEKEEVKLHVTLMNTLFREEEPEEMNVETENMMKNKWNKKTRRTFNAVNILQNFHDFYFGKMLLKSIQLSVRFSTAEDGYYKSSCVINI